MEDPVGTGPYKLAEWRRSQRIVLEANPDFRDVRYPDAACRQLRRRMSRPRRACRDASCRSCRASRSRSSRNRSRGCSRSAARDLDYVDVPSSLATTVLDGDKLKPELAKAGVKLHRQVEPSLAFFFFNMDDPVVGGYTPEKVALRRAIVMAQDRKERDRDPAQRPGRARHADDSAAGTRALAGAREQGSVRPGGRACAARPLRLQGPRRRRLPRVAGRQADRAGQGRRADRGGARRERAVEEEPRCDRPSRPSSSSRNGRSSTSAPRPGS